MKLIKGSKAPHLLQRLQILLDPVNTLESYAKKYGDIFIVQTFTGPVVSLNSPQTLQEILTKDNNQYEIPGSQLLQLMLGKYSVVSLSGDRHRRERKLLMPPFHGHRMRNYGELICNNRGLSYRPNTAWSITCIVISCVSLRAINFLPTVKLLATCLVILQINSP
ncbi:MAG: cytochrome P450 [Trichodesmium sp. St17_bin3_1_1]|nr:cytochrome P450 [Trichodesmium sp. St17_bin3_1_1]